MKAAAAGMAGEASARECCDEDEEEEEEDVAAGRQERTALDGQTAASPGN